MTSFWEKRFREEGRIWGKIPSRTAVYAIELFKKAGAREILIPGSGYGRNAVAFARAGFLVTGIEIYFTAAAVKDSNGDIIGAVETLEDISDIKRVEEELQTKQREMAAVLKGLRGVVVEYLDPSLKIIWANEEMAEEFCTSPEEVIGKHCYEVIRDRKEPCPDCTLSKCIPAGSVHDEVVSLPDGRVFLATCNPVMDDKGSVAGVIHTMINITERIRVEEELKNRKN